MHISLVQIYMISSNNGFQMLDSDLPYKRQDLIHYF